MLFEADSDSTSYDPWLPRTRSQQHHITVLCAPVVSQAKDRRSCCYSIRYHKVRRLERRMLLMDLKCSQKKIHTVCWYNGVSSVERQLIHVTQDRNLGCRKTAGAGIDGIEEYAWWFDFSHNNLLQATFHLYSLVLTCWWCFCFCFSGTLYFPLTGNISNLVINSTIVVFKNKANFWGIFFRLFTMNIKSVLLYLFTEVFSRSCQSVDSVVRCNMYPVKA